MTGTKFDAGKQRFDLIPPDALKETAAVFTFGANKYAANNWMQVTPHSRYVAALFRHLNAWQGGEDRDPETGLHHLAHVATNALFLLTFGLRKTPGDDRVHIVEPVPAPTENRKCLNSMTTNKPAPTFSPRSRPRCSRMKWGSEKRLKVLRPPIN
jgi:hypothetical protein